ncbi:MAG: DUF3027 domain-containing protein [Rhodomicrobium sp.]
MERLYGSAIFLELGQLSPLQSKQQHYNEGEACIAVSWDWRVESGSSVLYGSSNSRPRIDHGIRSLLNTEVHALSLVGEVPELAVHFSNGHCLRSMVMISGDPMWSIKLPCGEWLSARAGALLVGNGTRRIAEQETEALALAERAATRWGVPKAEPAQGRCANCASFVQIDGDGHLIDYGACVESSSPFDGRVVNRSSGCPFFTAHKNGSSFTTSP